MVNPLSSHQKVKKDIPKNNAEILIGSVKNALSSIIRKFKGFVIHAWIEDFEDQYLKTFKSIVVNAKEPKEIVSAVSKRMSDYEYTERILIIVKYTPHESFSVLATQTNTELEYAEFQKWKKLHKGMK